MSITSLGTAALYSAFESTQGTSNGQGSIQSEFQQLGQDLQSGNLTEAQEDFATLSQDFSGANQTNGTANNANNNPIAQAFNALSQDLQNGNLSAAQQDYATIQQDVQQQGAGQTHHHHRHGGGGAGGQEQNEINQAFSSLSQALQSNNLSGAQSAFATLQQDLQQLTQQGGSAGGTNAASNAEATGSNLSVTV